MHDNQKILLRTAERISSHLHGLKAAPIPVELPDGDWTQCQSLMRQIDLCTNRNWHHAAAVLKDRLERALERCSDRLQEISRQVSGSSRLLPPQTTREIFDDLVALSDEFEGVDDRWVESDAFGHDGADRPRGDRPRAFRDPAALGPDRRATPLRSRRTRTQPCGGIERDHTPARQGRTALRRGRTSVDRSSPSSRTLVGLLPDREPDPRHVQLRQRLRLAIALEREPVRRLRRRCL